MAEPVKWGLLSTAKINGSLLGGAREADGVEVVAVASRDHARAEAFAAEQGIPRALGSYEALLEDPEVEAVYVPLPNAMHLPWAERALEAGKHVLCEKPLSRRPADVEAAFDVAERAGRLLMEAFMWRYHPQTVALAQAVTDGVVGRPRVIRAAFGFDLRGDEDNVRWSGELDGGALMDVGCYCVSALRLLGGEPERASAELVEGGVGVDMRLAGVLRFPGDVLGLLDCGFDLAHRGGIEVVGETGTLVSHDPWHGKAPRLEITRHGEEPEAIEVGTANPYRLELEDLSAAIRGGEPPRARARGRRRAGPHDRRALPRGRGGPHGHRGLSPEPPAVPGWIRQGGVPRSRAASNTSIASSTTRSHSKTMPLQWLRSIPASPSRASPRTCCGSPVVYAASSSTIARKPRPDSPIADCATHTSVSNPTSTAVPRPVARIASTASGQPARPNVGFGSTGVPGGTRARISSAVGPSRSGASSTTTAGIPSSAAIPAIQAIRSTVAAARAASWASIPS